MYSYVKHYDEFVYNIKVNTQARGFFYVAFLIQTIKPCKNMQELVILFA